MRIRRLILLAFIFAPIGAAQCRSKEKGTVDDWTVPRRVMADVGGAWHTGIENTGVYKSGIGLNAGGGVLVSSRSAHYTDTGECTDRHLYLYVTGNFLFSQSDLTPGTAFNIGQMNQQQNPTLLSATSGSVKYYTFIGEPTVQFRLPNFRFPPKSKFASNFQFISFYFLGGFGVMRRDLNLTGPPILGGVIQNSSTVVADFTENSALWDAGGGISFGPFKQTAGLTYFVEFRRIQGLGVNGGTTLEPFSVGIRWGGSGGRVP